MLANRIAVGALWLVGARLATKALDLVAMLIVARLLSPEDFGLFALAATVLLVMEAVTDLSLSSAIVQMPDPPDSIYDTAFTLNLIRGLAVGLIIVGAAWPFAAIYGDPRLAPMVCALAAAPMFRSLGSPRIAHLQRELRFRPTFYLEAAGKLAAFFASVTAAFLTHSSWALVAGLIAAPAIATILSYRFAPYSPALGLAGWKPIIAFSGWLTLANTVNTLNWQVDRLLIGGRLGPNILGQYAVGNELASLPTNAPIQPMMQALYVGFSKLQDDRQRLRNAYLLSQSSVLAVALPSSIVVSVFAYPIIQLAIGSEWPMTAMVLQVLTPILALQMITGPAQALAMVTGNTSSIFHRDVWMLIVRLILVVIGLTMAGLPGILVARIGSGIFIILLNLSLMRRILGVSIFAQITSPWRIYVSGALFALCEYVLGREFRVLGQVSFDDLPIIAAIVACGAVVYVLSDILLWLIAAPAESVESRVLSAIKLHWLQRKASDASAA